LPSAQVLPEWINRSLAGYAFASNGDYPLNFVSHSMGSLHTPEARRRPIAKHLSPALCSCRSTTSSLERRLAVEIIPDQLRKPFREGRKLFAFPPASTQHVAFVFGAVDSTIVVCEPEKRAAAGLDIRWLLTIVEACVEPTFAVPIAGPSRCPRHRG